MNTELRAELLRRAEKDQAARRAMDADAWTAADAENLSWLRQVIAEVGWPGTSIAGADGARAAWLLAQHADRDPAFQRQCLGLLTAAVGQGEASAAELAYLTDRVLLAEGQPQVYGTQAQWRDGRCVARPLRDPARVDERRAEVGLEPLSEYLAAMAKHKDVPAMSYTTPCLGCGATIEFDPGETKTVTITCDACGRTTTLTLGDPGAS